MLEEREAGMTDDVLRRQCVRAFHESLGEESRQAGRRLRAGLGHRHRKNCHSQMAAEAHAIIRSEATEIFGEEFANNLRILYGGSVKPENVSWR